MTGYKLSEEQKHLCYKLREETGLGLVACKRCLIASEWNYEIAKRDYKHYWVKGKLK